MVRRSGSTATRSRSSTKRRSSSSPSRSRTTRSASRSSTRRAQGRTTASRASSRSRSRTSSRAGARTSSRAGTSSRSRARTTSSRSRSRTTSPRFSNAPRYWDDLEFTSSIGNQGRNRGNRLAGYAIEDDYEPSFFSNASRRNANWDSNDYAPARRQSRNSARQPQWNGSFGQFANASQTRRSPSRSQSSRRTVSRRTQTTSRGRSMSRAEAGRLGAEARWGRR